jgi:hypothetical protein
MPGPPERAAFTREVTATFTTAGVTRAVSVSMARSSALMALTSSAGSGPAAAAGGVAARTACGLNTSYPAAGNNNASASTLEISGRVFIHRYCLCKNLVTLHLSFG